MTINILGKGTGWNELPNKPDGLVYGINDACLRTHVDVTFHMHHLDEFAKQEHSASSTRLFVQYANEHPEMEVITTRLWKEIPNAKEFPLEDIIDRFKMCYFASTVDYAISYAIYQNAKEIRLYGINMSVNEEYREQKPGVEFWCGYAMGLGIKVIGQPLYSSLFKTRSGLLYGYLTNQWGVEQ